MEFNHALFTKILRTWPDIFFFIQNTTMDCRYNNRNSAIYSRHPTNKIQPLYQHPLQSTSIIFYRQKTEINYTYNTYSKTIGHPIWQSQKGCKFTCSRKHVKRNASRATVKFSSDGTKLSRSECGWVFLLLSVLEFLWGLCIWCLSVLVFICFCALSSLYCCFFVCKFFDLLVFDLKECVIFSLKHT